MHLSVRLASAVALVATTTFVATAQHAPARPTTWAITGARIEPMSGPAIATGTVVIRDGLIAAVGANVAAPSDARVIDGTGLTVYPGFIDGYGTLGMPTTTTGTAAAGAAAQAARRPAAPNSTYGAGLQPEVNAAAELDGSGTAFTAARTAGFTAALTAPGTGVFRGNSAVVALGSGRPADLILRADVAQHLGFSRGGGGGGGGGGAGYPGSLMGVMAQMRQQFLDAQHYRDVTAAYARNPRGAVRPAYDPSLEALQSVIAGREPVVFQANTEREIHRALDMAQEFSLRAIIAGGREAWKVTDRLRALNVPVLVDIDFPRRAAPAAGARSGNPADETPESMALLRTRVEAPQGPARLANAGVRFALVSGGDFTDYAANLRRALEGGLTRDQVLRAVTVEPATLFGVADRVGTIEIGKIANLTVVSGDLLATGGRVAQLFIDGERFELPAPTSTNAARGQ